jgi:hypothetical protein
VGAGDAAAVLAEVEAATVLSCGPNSFTSPPFTTKALLPAEAAIAPVARWAATCSNHLPFWLAISLAVPSAAMRSSCHRRRRSRSRRPPDRRPAPAPRRCATVRRRRLGGVDVGRQQAHAAIAQGERRDRSILAEGTGSAGASRQRSGPAAGSAARPDLKDRASRLLQAVVEAALEVLAVEVAADEHELARTLLAVFQGVPQSESIIMCTP